VDCPRHGEHQEKTSIISSSSTRPWYVQIDTPLLKTRTKSLCQAKKLKKEWVIKQKIKSKWKSQKRREAILSQPDTSTQPSSLREERSVSKDDAEIDENDDEVQQCSDSEDEPVPSASVQPRKQRPLEQKKDGPTTTGSSLRDLQKQAYSPASLHHYKSRPLRHPKNRTASNEDSFRRREASIGAPKRGRGGGQPNMRLRMTAMLEKIRRDCS
jgi:hypothetical protein